MIEYEMKKKLEELLSYEDQTLHKKVESILNVLS